jgi:hypothetical protein
MIKELILEKKSTIVNNWIQSIYETYPSETSNFLRDQKNRFSNPVGHAIADCAEKILDVLIESFDIQKIKIVLQELIKIRAVQDFSPSHAVGFIFLLKNSILSQLKDKIENDNICEEYLLIESQIDGITMAAFDTYMEAREKLFQIHINEIKSRSQNIIG